MNRINHSSRFIEMFGNAENTKPLSACIDTTFPGEWGEDDSEGTGVNVIRTTNFTNSGKLDLTNVVTRKIDQAKIDKKHLIPGDIILERSGGTADNPVGRVVYFEAIGTFLFNNFTQLLRCKDGVNSLFVFYSLYNYYHTHKSEIRSMGNKTTGIQNLKMDKYWEIPIADASPEQQDLFVCLYNQADKSKFFGFKSRFIEMFGDPVNNSKGWPVLTMKESSELLSDGPFGSNLKSEHYTEKGIRVIRLQNICQGYFEDTDKAFVSEEHYRLLEKYTCKPGDIVIGTLGEPNLRACVIPLTVPISINKADCVHYIPRSSLLNTTFACAYINNPGLLHIASSSLHGTTRSRIAARQVSQLPIFIPPIRLQLEYERFAKQADKSKLLN